MKKEVTRTQRIQAQADAHDGDEFLLSGRELSDLYETLGLIVSEIKVILFWFGKKNTPNHIMRNVRIDARKIILKASRKLK